MSGPKSSEKTQADIPSMDFSDLETLKKDPAGRQMDDVFKSALEESIATGDSMSTKDQELEIEDVGELDLNLGDDEVPTGNQENEGLDLSFSESETLEIGEASSSEELSLDDRTYGELSLGDDDDELIALGPGHEEPSIQTETSNELSLEEETPDLPAEDSLELGDFSNGPEESPLSLDDDVLNLSQGESDHGALDLGGAEADLSDDAKEKLKEIDAIMDVDASQVGIKNMFASEAPSGGDLDEPLVSDDLDLDSLNFGAEEKVEAVVAPVKEERPKKKKAKERDLGEDLKEISGAYSGEMERLQATLSNLRSDREELLQKIQTLEEEKVLHNRQLLTIRAELDEKKIELTIIRKKLNEEVNELKDRLRVFDEKRLILEEKNRLLTQELDKAAQKNKIDVKKVQMRERELEQKLELLKSDAETQIRNRDLKILELKRKIDAMEFDMESITTQEKRSVESRFELEDKLDKAIKTLRSAITVLEDESDRGNALSALKKNIDM